MPVQIDHCPYLLAGSKTTYKRDFAYSVSSGSVAPNTFGTVGELVSAVEGLFLLLGVLIQECLNSLRVLKQLLLAGERIVGWLRG